MRRSQDLWDICNKWGVVIDVYIAAKRSKSRHRFGFVRFINVNDINQLVSIKNALGRGAWVVSHLFADVENGPGQQISDKSGKYGTCNAGAESVGGFRIVNKYLSVHFRALKHILLRDSIDVGLRYVGGLGFDERCCMDRPMGLPIGIMGLHRLKEVGFVGNTVTDMVSDDQCPHGKSGFAEEYVRGGESDLVNSFEEGEIRDETDVTTDDNEDVTQVIAPAKDSSLRLQSTPTGY
ncbi:RNA-directed DNA polymerase, eukaryota, nucleotide-binding alpha-beta plait domain protein [Tanacetum coccineum]|uniref:RNA-directed DNA polymerase, eukaryota, nucleotide-binding alpha-beta plait domain protein n=1 Tax=Tanacetum coccineum TaxID=301880 RepID=A0ABQ5AMZ2_9ASTR